MRRLLLITLLASAVGCAGAYVPKTPAEAAAVANALAVRSLTVLKDAGVLASDVRRAARATLPPAAFATFDGQRCDPPAPASCVESGWLKLQHLADRAIAIIEKAGVTVSDMAAAVKPLWEAAQDLASGSVGALSFGTLLAVLQSVLALVGG